MKTVRRGVSETGGGGAHPVVSMNEIHSFIQKNAFLFAKNVTFCNKNKQANPAQI